MSESDNDIVLRFPDHDVTPDLVRATEPTYMNEHVNDQDEHQVNN